MTRPATRALAKVKTGSRKRGAVRPGGQVKSFDQLEARAVEAARLLKLMANEQRLTVLCRLSHAELSVTELGAYVNLSQSALSQHLAKLRVDGLVTTRRDAQTIYYRLADPNVEKLIGVLCDVFGNPRRR